MAYILIRHNVADYAKWKPVFDENAAARKAGGSKGGHLFRSADNPNEVVVLLEWDSIEKARQFTQSNELREAMQNAGVTGRPDLFFLDEVGKVHV